MNDGHMGHRQEAVALNDAVEILFEERGAAGIATLNRPKALNAVTHNMVRLLHAKLNEWEHNPAITRVILKAAGEKAFCAGGDIRAIYDMGRQGRFKEAVLFWREEYQLNRAIKRYPKPFISWIDGIVMGGGFGLSAHGSHRIAGDKYLFAMPEVGIGFFPDVGATYVLPRVPGMVGRYLAVTGARIKAGDALALGLATSFTPTTLFPALLDELAAGSEVERTIRKFEGPYKAAELDVNRAIIHAAFAQDDVASILRELDRFAEAGSQFAAETAKSMRHKSPTSMAIALEQMKCGGSLTFEDALALEYRIVTNIGAGTDFYEGVRAVLVDKDNKPVWRPARIEDVLKSDIERYFAPSPQFELKFT